MIDNNIRYSFFHLEKFNDDLFKKPSFSFFNEPLIFEMIRSKQNPRS